MVTVLKVILSISLLQQAQLLAIITLMITVIGRWLKKLKPLTTTDTKKHKGFFKDTSINLERELSMYRVRRAWYLH